MPSYSDAAFVLERLAQRDQFVLANSCRWTPSKGVLAERAGVIQTDVGTLIGVGDIPSVVGIISGGEFAVPGFALTPLGTREYAGEMLRERFGLAADGAWVWMHTSSRPPSVCGEENVVRLEERSEEVADVIAEANPRSHAATSLENHEWWGYEVDGRVLGVCGVDRHGVVAGTPEAARHGVRLSGFGTRPDARRRGVGAALMAGVTRRFVSEFGLVHFGVWRDNEDALRLYRRLGYSTGAQIQNFTRV